MQILMVNNCAELNDLFCNCLEFSSHKLFRSSGSSLERIMQMESFDLVFVCVEEFDDVELQVCERVRALANHNDTFLVLSCSHFREDFIQRAFNLGADEYLTSPISLDDLGLLLCLMERIQKASFDSRSAETKLAA